MKETISFSICQIVSKFIRSVKVTLFLMTVIIFVARIYNSYLPFSN